MRVSRSTGWHRVAGLGSVRVIRDRRSWLIYSCDGRWGFDFSRVSMKSVKFRVNTYQQRLMERLTAQSRAIVRIHRTTLASGHNLGLQCPSPEKRDPSYDRVPVSSFQAMSYIASLQNCHFLGWVARNLAQTCHGRRTNRRSLVEVSCPLPLAGKYHCQGRRKGRNPSRLSQKARLLLQRHSCRPAHEVQEIESEEEDQSYRRKTGDSDSRWPIWSRFFSTSLCSGVRLLRKGKGDRLIPCLCLCLCL